MADASAPYRVVGVVLGVLLACASFASSAGTGGRPRRLVFFLLDLVRSRLGASDRALTRT